MRVWVVKSVKLFNDVRQADITVQCYTILSSVIHLKQLKIQAIFILYVKCHSEPDSSVFVQITTVFVNWFSS